MNIGQLVDIGNHDFQGSIGKVSKVTPEGIWFSFPFENIDCSWFFPFGESWIMRPFDNL